MGRLAAFALVLVVGGCYQSRLPAGYCRTDADCRCGTYCDRLHGYCVEAWGRWDSWCRDAGTHD